MSALLISNHNKTSVQTIIICIKINYYDLYSNKIENTQILID